MESKNESTHLKRICIENGSNIFYFEDYSKRAWGMISFLLVIWSYTPILHKNAEKPTVMWFFTKNCFKSTVTTQHDTTPHEK